MDYIPPTWHNNYNNQHLIEVAEDGTIRPKPEYQAYADGVNQWLEREGRNDRLIWDGIIASFCLRSIKEEDQ